MMWAVSLCLQICYVEKRAVKHKRRHRRRKHSIPWEKIKIVGGVTNCGAATNRAGAGKAGGGGGKCPLGMGSSAKDKDV